MAKMRIASRVSAKEIMKRKRDLKLKDTPSPEADKKDREPTPKSPRLKKVKYTRF